MGKGRLTSWAINEIDVLKVRVLKLGMAKGWERGIKKVSNDGETAEESCGYTSGDNTEGEEDEDEARLYGGAGTYDDRFRAIGANGDHYSPEATADG